MTHITSTTPHMLAILALVIAGGLTPLLSFLYFKR